MPRAWSFSQGARMSCNRVQSANRPVGSAELFVNACAVGVRETRA